MKGANKKKTRITFVVIAVLMAGILALGAVAASQSFSSQAAQSAKFGGLGSAHEHGAFLVKLNGTLIDFSIPQYQVRSPYIHVENGDGFTIHKHAKSVPFGEFIHSLDMDIRNGCFYLDDGKTYCNGADGKSLGFYVNEVRIDSIMNYVLNDGDRILVVYGDNSQDAVNRDFDLLNQLTIKPA